MDFPVRLLTHPSVGLIVIALDVACGRVDESNPLMQRERAQASFSEVFSIQGNIIFHQNGKRGLKVEAKVCTNVTKSVFGQQDLPAEEFLDVSLNFISQYALHDA